MKKHILLAVGALVIATPLFVTAQNITAEELRQRIADLTAQIQRLQAQPEALQNKPKEMWVPE